MNCAACHRLIARGENLPCCSCKDTYHFACLNMLTSYYVENKITLMRSWRCPRCENVTKRTRNDDTPTRKQHCSSLNDTTMSIDDHEHNSVEMSCKTSHSVQTNRIQNLHPNASTITLEQFSRLLETTLETKLEQHKKSILSEIKMTVEGEINKAMNQLRQEISLKTDDIKTEQNNIRGDVEYLDMKIEKLELETKELQKTIRNLQNTSRKIEKDEDKKIVLYGLTEYPNEREYDIEKRILHLFMDTMNIDLTGYIEGIFRMGRTGSRRPVQIELISKRMTKYIMKNVKLLKSTGLYVTEYLDKTTLQERRNLHDRNSQRPSRQIRTMSPQDQKQNPNPNRPSTSSTTTSGQFNNTVRHSFRN